MGGVCTLNTHMLPVHRSWATPGPRIQTPFSLNKYKMRKQINRFTFVQVECLYLFVMNCDIHVYIYLKKVIVHKRFELMYFYSLKYDFGVNFVVLRAILSWCPET